MHNEETSSLRLLLLLCCFMLLLGVYLHREPEAIDETLMYVDRIAVQLAEVIREDLLDTSPAPSVASYRDSSSNTSHTGYYAEPTVSPTPIYIDPNWDISPEYDSVTYYERDEREPDYSIINSLETNKVTVHYSWKSYYGKQSASWDLKVDENLYEYFSGLPRYYHTEDYDKYINDPANARMIDRVATGLEHLGDDRGYSQAEVAREAMAFCQAMTYEYDLDEDGNKIEWPKYPIETLYDGGGDCEDTSILLAGLISRLGYGVALIDLDGHMAIGVKGSDLGGTYFTHDGVKYYYVETTRSGRKIGELPEKIKNRELEHVYPIKWHSPDE